MLSVSRRTLPQALSTLSTALVAALLVAGLVSSGDTRAQERSAHKNGAKSAPPGAVAFRGATVETMGPSGRLENATVIVRDGKIAAVGTDVAIPDDARVVDVTGKTILPGVVDPYFVYSSQGAGLGGGGRGGRGGGRGRGGFQAPQAPTAGGYRRMAEYFYPYDVDLVPSYRSGITTANLVLTGTGQSAIARVTPDDMEHLLLQPDGYLYAAVTNSTSSLNFVRNGLNPQANAGRGGAGGRGGFGGRGGGRGGRGGGGGNVDDVQVDGGTFDRQFQDQDQDQGNNNAEEEAASPGSAEELWKKVRAGEQPLVVNVNNAAAILHLLKAVKDYKDVKLAMVCSGTNLYEALDSLKDKNVTLILQPSIDSVPGTREWINVAAMAQERGIPFVLSMSLNRGQMNAQQTDPFFAVSQLVKTGLPREAALQAMTIGPAKLLGLGDSLGSLEENKTANMLIFDGDPLETGSRLEEVVVEGRTVHEN